MTDNLIVLNHESATPPFEQIRRQIRGLIASGLLRLGAALPSVRQLANDLDVAPNTVVRAYKELEREGWVVTSARKKVMVAPQLPDIAHDEKQQQLEEAVAELLITVYQLEISPDEVHAEIDRQMREKDRGSRAEGS